MRRSPAPQHAALACATAAPSIVVAAADTNNSCAASAPFLPLFPALKELNLSFNNLTTLDQDAEMVRFFELDTPKLTSLNLTGNKIAISNNSNNSVKVENDSYLSRLDVLYLAENPMIVSTNYSSSSASSTSVTVVEEPLAALEWLRVRCPKVKSLRVTYQDFFGLPSYRSDEQQQEQLTLSNTKRPTSSLSEVQQRSLVIAAMTQIETLNSGPVRAKERLDAEMSYLQVAKAKKGQAEQQNSSTSSTSASSATNRFFPWKLFPLLDFLAEKHKNVILTSLNNDGKSGSNITANGLATGSALAYTLKLTFKVLTEEVREIKTGASSQQQHQQKEELVSPPRVIRTVSKIPMAEDVTRTVPGNMTVGKLKSFIAAIYPSVASAAQQKKIQAFAEDNGGSASAVVLEAVDDENPLILCGVPSNAVIEVFV